MTSARSSGRWAVAQITGASTVAENLAQCCARIAAAADRGCELVALPENCTYMGPERDKCAHAEPLTGPTVSALRAAAREQGLFVLAGSVIEASEDPDRPYSTSLLIDPEGTITAHYRKIHLFDVDVAGDRSYRESDAISGGRPKAVLGQVGAITVGLTICFDLRFPWLYRALVGAGAEAIFVPAAFTVPTGSDHWEVLLRARAIETQCYVLAPGQFGRHQTGRRTFGRSTIIDPWGTVAATVPDGGELAVATLDVERIRAVRSRMPMKSQEPRG